VLSAPFASICVVALLVAALAPWGVRLLEGALVRRLLRRTQRVIARASRPGAQPSDSLDRSSSQSKGRIERNARSGSSRLRPDA
jgi:hypothetical protein